MRQPIGLSKQPTLQQNFAQNYLMQNKKTEPKYATFCNFSNSRLVLYTQPISPKFPDRNDLFKENFQSTKNKGIVSEGTKKQIRNILISWIDSVEQFAHTYNKKRNWINNQITFVTLTLPSKQQHSDTECNRLLLNEFLIYLKRKTNISAYLWVAEKQENGNIHWHILTTSYINWQTIRRLWNKTLDKNGYIKQYRENQNEFHKDGFKVREELLTKWCPKRKMIVDNWTKEKQLDAYNEGIKCNWNNPNSTDIHKLVNVKSIQKYVVKYMTKGVDQECKDIVKNATSELKTKREIKELIAQHIQKNHSHKLLNCSHWSCSDNLRKLERYTSMVNYELDAIIDKVKLADEKNVFKNDYCMIVGGTELNDFDKYAEYHYNYIKEINQKNFEKIYTRNQNSTIFAMQKEEEISSVEVQLISNNSADRKMKRDNKLVALLLFNQTLNQNYGKENFNNYKKSREKSRTKTRTKSG